MTINPIAIPSQEDTVSLVAPPSEPGTCVVIRTGNSDCLAHFFPALYQLNLIKAGSEEKVDLGFSGSRLLERLLQAPGEVISREELMSHAWADRVVGQGSLNQQIYTLRQILGDEKEREIIQTLPRRGYMLNPKYIDSRISLEADSADSRQLTPSATPLATPVGAKEPAAVLDAALMAAAKANSGARSFWTKQFPWVGICLAGLIGWFLVKQQDTPHTAPPPVTHLTLTYAPEAPGQLIELAPLGEALVAKVQQLTQEPLQLVLGLHNEVLTLVCLHDDGSAHSLHIPVSGIEGLTKADLAECL